MRIAALCLAAVACCTLISSVVAGDQWVVYPGKDGPGKGKHVVLVAGDDEYRSEETLPQMGKILSQRHGFKCTVLFPIDPQDGTIKPNHQTNIPGLEALKSADLMVIFLRFRDLPDDQMKHIVDFVDAGKPVIGMRTATHAFHLRKYKKHIEYTNGFNGKDNPDWRDGFGRYVLGEKWISHHGRHGTESTLGVIPEDVKGHPIVRGVGQIWGPTDVYGVRLPLPGDSKAIVLGQVLTGMKPTDPPVKGKKNEPMIPVAWTKTYKSKSGKVGRVFTTTMGASQDFSSEGLRRLLINASYWCLGMDVPAKSNVDIVGEYKPTRFGFGSFTKGVKPEAHKL